MSPAEPLKEDTSYPIAASGSPENSEILPSKISASLKHLQTLADTADPISAALEFAKMQRASVEDVILACNFARNVIRRFDRLALDEFSKVLVRERILSKADLKIGMTSGSKLSMFRKIGEYAPLLLRHEILCRLPWGYSVIYHVVRLYELLGGDKEAKTTTLIGILGLCDGTLSREYLINAINLAKHENSNLNPSNIESGQPDQSTTVLPLSESGERFDLLLLTPGPSDLRLLREDYPDAQTLFRCLPFRGLLAEQAVIIVICLLKDLPTITRRLLPCCGLDRFSNVLLAREPTGPDVSNAEVIVLAERGRKRIIEHLDTWLAGDGPIDAHSSATWLAPSAGQKLHAFATTASEDWRTLIGESTWTEKPSLR